MNIFKIADFNLRNQNQREYLKNNAVTTFIIKTKTLNGSVCRLIYIMTALLLSKMWGPTLRDDLFS